MHTTVLEIPRGHAHRQGRATARLVLLVLLGWVIVLALALAPPLHAEVGAQAAPMATAAEPAQAADAPPLFTEWRTFTTADGLPSDVVFSVVADGDTLWAGTDNGLARYKDGKWTSWGREDGLVYPVITSLAVDTDNGDLWIGTLGGVSRFSGGRFENYTQMTSGLANDVVYAIASAGRYVWAATAAGASRFDTWKDRWEIFTNTNAPMHEIWCYGLAVDGEELYMAVWGGGVLRWDREKERWRDYRDPDGELELDLLRDDGPVSDVVASVSHADGVLWAGTYFGVNRFDGRRWSSFATEDSPLVSNFINFVRSEGTGAWLATDRGLVHTDGVTWTTYSHGQSADGGTVKIDGPSGERIVPIHGSMPSDYILGVVRQGDEVWTATEHGLGLGRPANDRTASGPDGAAATDKPRSPSASSIPSTEHTAKGDRS